GRGIVGTHRRRADPVDRLAIGLQRQQEPLDTLLISLLPLVRSRCEPTILGPDLLAVIGADHDHDHVRLVLRQYLGDLAGPIEMIIADEAGRAVGAVDHGQARLLGKRLVEPPGEAAGDEVADHQNLAGIGILGLDLDRRIDRLRRCRRTLLARLLGPARLLPALRTGRTTATDLLLRHHFTRRRPLYTEQAIEKAAGTTAELRVSGLDADETQHDQNSEGGTKPTNQHGPILGEASASPRRASPEE